MSDDPSCSSSSDGDVHPSWSRFLSWMHGICVVTFDLELGQAMELVYPPDVKLSEQDVTNICYLAFPDSNSGCMGDTKFHFKFRHSSTAGIGLTPSYLKYNRTSPSSLQAESGYLYGYVYFRQVKDQTLPRGYFQKSVIILSRLPFINLFLRVCDMIAPEFFDNGVVSIEVACHDVDQWPLPQPGNLINLPLLGSVLQVQIPSENSQYNITSLVSCSTPEADIIPSLHVNNLYTCLGDCVYQIHVLWELVMIGEPVVVMAWSPELCSQLVQALVSLILPLRYYAEYRPYFTIHDTEFKDYTRPSQKPPSVILGVTNPFFSKTLRHWPHIVKMERAQAVHKHRVKKSTLSKSFENKSGIYTRYEPYLHKDKALLKKLHKGAQTGRPHQVQSALLRRHLLELTQSFMIPLERYMANLMPLHRDISPFRAVPSPCPFNPEDFISTLEKSGPQLTTGVTGDWAGLYRRFLRSPNFAGWYQERYRAMTSKLSKIQLEALSEADLKTWLVGKQEVEIVDLFLKIRCKISESKCCTDSNIPLNVENKLKKQLDDIIVNLPDDLQSVLTSSDVNS